MKMADNYRIQAAQAKARFLQYDQEQLIQKLGLKADEEYLYAAFIHMPYRICRDTGDLEKWADGHWQSADSHGEVMTLLDLVCDSRADRRLSGRLKSMTDFGLMFHRSLLEGADPWAERFQSDLPGFRRACTALGGKEGTIGDVSYAIEVFDGLCLVLQLWLGDEEFPASLRFLWDENALMYLKYETMYFARNLVLQRIAGEMEKAHG